MYYGGSGFFIIIVLMMIAGLTSMRVKSTFKEFHKIRNIRGLTGAQAAEIILRNNGINDVRVERVSGYLSDHYDPRSKVIRLSEPVFDNPSIASVSVACHETGHALQHALGYSPLSMRTAILPMAQFGSKALFPLFIAGMIFSIPSLVSVGIIFFTFSVIFQLVTLPVEFNASSRALKMMDEYGILSNEENASAKKVLNAAAMTYVAAAAVAIGQLIRLILLNRRN